MTAWATARGFDPDTGLCAVATFANANGGRLPDNLAELCSWGTANGLHTADGGWTCTMPAEVPGAGGLTLPADLERWWDEQMGPVRAWVYAHPWEAGAIALASVALVVTAGRRR
jgi:hypothetical protein